MMIYKRYPLRTNFVLLVLSVLLFLFDTDSFAKTVHINEYAKNGDNISLILQRLIDNYDIVIIDEGCWRVSPGIKLRSGVTIKGVGASKSILERDNSKLLMGGMLFMTDMAIPDTYTKKDVADGFKRDRVIYHNIIFQDLTIDFNRNPEQYLHEELAKNNIYGIAFIRAANCSVERCSFVDRMTKDCNNGYPAIVIYQSEKVKICNNSSDRVTFVQVIYSNNVQINKNYCRNSIGTPIEAISGSGHRFENNTINGVYWKVSCMGINATNCIVKDNNVYSSKDNISCLTLGHEHSLHSASGSIVQSNTFVSDGCRCILVQNGENILVRDNDCRCIINTDASPLISGCVIASGNAEGIKGLKILKNRLTTMGEGTCGSVTYRGSGTIYIMGNEITANRGVSIFTREDVVAVIKDNILNSSNYSIQADCGLLQVVDNKLCDGIVTTARNIEIRNNTFQKTNNFSFLGKKWIRVTIERNVIDTNLETNTQGLCAFMLDASEKNEAYDVNNIKIRKNKTISGSAVKLLSISGVKNCSQLKMIERYK